MLAPVAPFAVTAGGPAVVARGRRQIEIRRRAARDEIAEEPERELVARIARQLPVGSHVQVELLPRRIAAEEAVEECPVGRARQPAAARVDPVVSPNASVSIFEVKQDRVTVLWTEGLQSLPADYAAK